MTGTYGTIDPFTLGPLAFPIGLEWCQVKKLHNSDLPGVQRIISSFNNITIKEYHAKNFVKVYMLEKM